MRWSAFGGRLWWSGRGQGGILILIACAEFAWDLALESYCVRTQLIAAVLASHSLILI
jgi:hypothetical protein